MADSLVNDGALYCPFCGVGQPRGFDNPDIANISFCSCGQGLVGQVNFCPNCGQTLRPGASRHRGSVSSSRLYKPLPVNRGLRPETMVTAPSLAETEPSGEPELPDWARRSSARRNLPMLYVLLFFAVALLGAGIYIAVRPIFGF